MLFRQIWTTRRLHRIPLPALPEFTSVKSFCRHFSEYFVEKIGTIRSRFPDKVQNIPSVQKTEIRSKMNVFERATEDEIKILILSFDRQNHMLLTCVFGTLFNRSFNAFMKCQSKNIYYYL